MPTRDEVTEFSPQLCGQIFGFPRVGFLCNGKPIHLPPCVRSFPPLSSTAGDIIIIGYRSRGKWPTASSTPLTNAAPHHYGDSVGQLEEDRLSPVRD